MNQPKTNSVVKKGNAWCVVHGHPKKKGSKTDKPKGTVIKCFSIAQFGEKKARQKAQGLHYVITHPEAKKNESISEKEINDMKALTKQVDMFICPLCNAEMKTLVKECPNCHAGLEDSMPPALKHNKKDVGYSSLKHLMSDMARQDTLDGEDYIVVPTIPLVEGVHNGVLYLAAEMEMFPEAWNGVQLPINHPMKDGKPTSANDPKVIEEQGVGQLFNMEFEAANGNPARLKGEAWIKIAKLATVPEGADLRKKLDANEPIEVSTGLFTEDTKEDGEWNGEKYEFVAHNYRPDHLALLPNAVGACSWEDGAGMPRVNQEEGDKDDVNVNEREKKDALNVLKEVFKLAKSVGLKVQELSLHDMFSQLSAMVREKINPPAGDYVFLKEVFKKYFVYEHETGGKVKLYKQNYSVKGEEVELTGEVTEVKEQKKYVTVNDSDGSSTDMKGGKIMDRGEKVKALIADKKTQWGEADSEMLNGLSDEQFAKMETLQQNQKVDEPAANDSDTSDGDKPKDKDEDEDAAPKKNEDEKPQTADDYIDAAPAGIQGTLRRALKRDEAQKDKLVKSLKENKRNEFSESELKGMEIEALEKLAKLGQIEADFSGRGDAEPATNVDEDDVPDMPSLDAKKE